MQYMSWKRHFSICLPLPFVLYICLMHCRDLWRFFFQLPEWHTHQIWTSARIGQKTQKQGSCTLFKNLKLYDLKETSARPDRQSASDISTLTNLFQLSPLSIASMILHTFYRFARYLQSLFVKWTPTPPLISFPQFCQLVSMPKLLISYSYSLHLTSFSFLPSSSPFHSSLIESPSLCLIIIIAPSSSPLLLSTLTSVPYTPAKAVKRKPS